MKFTKFDENNMNSDLETIGLAQISKISSIIHFHEEVQALKPIEFIIKHLATYEATAWSLIPLTIKLQKNPNDKKLKETCDFLKNQLILTHNQTLDLIANLGTETH